MKRALSRKNLWDALPRPMKAAAGAFLGTVPPRYLLGRSFRRHLAFVRRAQGWSADQTRAYQLTELKRICALAYERTPFYRRVFQRIGFDPRDVTSHDAVGKLPTIDRHTIREHLDDMCTVSPASSCVDFVSTGGTGGMPLSFYISARRSAVEYAYLTASWERVGYALGAPLAVFRGRVVLEGRDGMRHEYDPLLRHHYFSNFHMTDANMRRYLDYIRRIGPCFLHVYPSSAYALARFLRRTRATAPQNIRGIIAESEIVYPDQRRLVEALFGCRYFSCYGHSEKLVLGAECEHTSDYHIWPTYGYFELLGENGQPITTPGERGEIVGTGFINRVVPFIRYRTGDYATYVGPRCPACGRQHPIIGDIRGHRTQEALIAADRSEITWTALNMHDDTFTRVRQFQFYQDTLGKAVLRIIPAEGFGEKDMRRIERNLHAKLAGRLELTLELTGSISVSPLGKAIYVDQRILSATQNT